MGNTTEGGGHILNYSDKTIGYYNQNAESFVEGTVDAKMNAIQEKFLSHVKKGGLILDLGCGSGRDSKEFLNRGYRVVMVDGSARLCEAAGDLTGHKVIQSSFQEYFPEEQFDGIWACSSLLHLNKAEMEEVIRRMTDALKPQGCFYLSYKYGNYSGERRGRYFTDMDEQAIREMVEKVPGLEIQEISLTGDVRPGRSDEKWLNAFCFKTGVSDS